MTAASWRVTRHSSHRGLHVASVAGAARHHAAELQSDDVASGHALKLRRDPANTHDANAIAVHGAASEQIGWVPRELAAEIAPELDAGEPWSAIARSAKSTSRDSHRCRACSVTCVRC